MSDKKSVSKKSEYSVAEQSASLFVTEDKSLAALLIRHDIKVRDFVLLSFLDGRGQIKIVELSRATGIEPEKVEQSLNRLASAGLVVRDPPGEVNKYDEMAKLTGRGQEIVSRINSQL